MRQSLLPFAAALALVAAATAATATQVFDSPWVTRTGGPYADNAYAVATDPTGIYVVGSVVGAPDGTHPRPGLATAAFDAAADAVRAGAQPPVSRLTRAARQARVAASLRAAATVQGYQNATDNQFEDVYVAKYAHATGALLWSARCGGILADVAVGVAVSEAGNAVFVSGYSVSPVGYYGPHTVAGFGRTDGLLAKLDATTGAWLWVTTMGGRGDDWASAVAVDPHESLDHQHLYVVGDHDSSPFHFGGSVLTGRSAGAAPSATLDVRLGGDDLHVVRVDALTGAAVWAMTGGGEGDDIPWAAAVDPHGTLVVAGHLHSDRATVGNATFRVAGTAAGPTYAFGPSPVFDFTNRACCDGTGNADIMVLRVTDAATVEYLATAGSYQPEESVSVALDRAGHVYTVGTAEAASQLAFGPDILLPQFARAANGYLAKLDLRGEWVWAVAFPDVVPAGLSLDAETGDSFVAGSFARASVQVRGTAAEPVGVSNAVYNTDPTGATSDMLVAQLNGAGVLQWLWSSGGTGDDVARAVALLPAVAGLADTSRWRLAVAGTFQSPSLAWTSRPATTTTLAPGTTTAADPPTLINANDAGRPAPTADIVVGLLRRDVPDPPPGNGGAAAVAGPTLLASAAVALVASLLVTQRLL